MKAAKWIISGVVIVALICGGIYQNSRISRLEEEVHNMAEFKAAGNNMLSELKIDVEGIRALLSQSTRGYVVPHPINLNEAAATEIFTHEHGLYNFCITRYINLCYMFYNHGTPANPNQPKVVGLAKSSDLGVNWTVLNDNLISPGADGQWDDKAIEAHSLLFMANKFRLYYGGYDGANWRCGYAEADNIEGPYTKYSGNPVITLGDPDAWDDTQVADPHVFWYRGKFHMLYAGVKGTGGWQIGHATSNDGITWSKDAGNPVIAIGAANTWDDTSICPGGVLITFNGGLMFICHGRAIIGAHGAWTLGLFTSDDSSTWTEYPHNPVLGADDDELARVHADLFIDGNKLILLYTRGDLSGAPAYRLAIQLPP